MLWCSKVSGMHYSGTNVPLVPAPMAPLAPAHPTSSTRSKCCFIVIHRSDGCCALNTGKFKAAELISFLSRQSGSAANDEADDTSTSQEPDKDSGQKQKQEEKKDPKVVRDLNMTEFEGLSDEEDAWLVAFYSGAVTYGHSSQTILCILM